MRKVVPLALLATLIWALPACTKSGDETPEKGAQSETKEKKGAKEKISSPPADLAQAKTSAPTAPAPTTGGQQPGPTASSPPATGTQQPATSAEGGSDRPPPPQADPPAAEATSGVAPTASTGPGEVPPPAVPFQPKPVKSLTQLEILLDGSGSMEAPLENTTKVAIAKGALAGLVGQPVPAESRRSLGLRVFGTLQPPEANRCDDSVQLAPVAVPDAAKLRDLIDGYTPKGNSSLAFAIEQAAQDFPVAADADNVLLLIADGGDSCNADPCAAAARIHAGSAHVIIHAIGFDVDQKAQDQLRCIAEKSDGHFYLARSAAELYTAVDQATYAHLPYNLRLKILAGATPVPAQVTVYKSGTDQVVEQTAAPGIKFFQLAPGRYDVAVECLEAIATPKPAKRVTGVEIQTSTRAEQIVQFDLGQIGVSALDPDGQQIAADYELRTTGTPTVLGTFHGGPEGKTVAVPPGTYDLAVRAVTAAEIPLAATATGLLVRSGETTQRLFPFEAGTLFLRAQSLNGQFLKATYQIAAADRPDETLLEGIIPPEGIGVAIPTGTYTVSLKPADPEWQGLGDATAGNLVITAHETTQQLVTFVTGTLQLIGKDLGKGGKTAPVKTEFQLRRSGSPEVIARLVAEGTPGTLYVAPGTYDLTALNLQANMTPAPSILWEGITIGAGVTLSREALFQLGELKLTGKTAKGDLLPAIFTVFRAGAAEPLGTIRSAADPVLFRLTPGLYDVRAEDAAARSDPKPSVWFHGLAVAGNALTARDAIFSVGLLKLGCRGENNVTIECEYRIFAYGTDRPLFSGTTGAQWKEFEIAPGSYYLEAGHHDAQVEQLLKKWVNIRIAENAVVEQVIRF